MFFLTAILTAATVRGCLLVRRHLGWVFFERGHLNWHRTTHVGPPKRNMTSHILILLCPKDTADSELLCRSVSTTPPLELRCEPLFENKNVPTLFLFLSRLFIGEFIAISAAYSLKGTLLQGGDRLGPFWGCEPDLLSRHGHGPTSCAIAMDENKNACKIQEIGRLIFYHYWCWRARGAAPVKTSTGNNLPRKYQRIPRN